MQQMIRLLPFGSADGATNMAADEVMLESAVEGVASLRFYTWAEPTLSLGYFQSAAERTGRLAELAWVRRATGGAAIVHHHELTYALALPPGKQWTSAENWICRMHHILQRVLRSHGIESHAVVCGEEQKLGPVVCFLHQTAGDVLIGGSKVAGSAQRKMRGALLQHGSILLHRSEYVPELPGIGDVVPTFRLSPQQLAGELCAMFATDTGWLIQPGDWTAAEQQRLSVVREEKYANPAWNEKR